MQRKECMKKVNKRDAENRAHRNKPRTKPLPVDYSDLVVIGAVLALVFLSGCATEPGGGSNNSSPRYAATIGRASTH